MSITLYSADVCPYCVRTRLVLNGKGIEYDLVQVDLSDKPAWLRELNPRNRVPVMDVDGQVLWSPRRSTTSSTRRTRSRP